MSRGLHQRLDGSRLGRRLALGLNRLGLPWQRWPVRVGGFRMTAHTADRWLALWLWERGLLERAGLLWQSRVCRRGMRAVDIGANVGLYTLRFAAAAGPDGCVWAFEPDAGNYQTLRANLDRNGFGSVIAERKAVGAQSGQGLLYLDDAHHGNHRLFRSSANTRSAPVEIVALDDYFGPDPELDVVKIDVQGAEYDVLRGMRRILSAKTNPTVLCEMSVRDPVAGGGGAEPALRFLAELGYSLAWLDERSGALRPASHAAEALERIAHLPYANIVATASRRRGIAEGGEA